LGYRGFDAPDAEAATSSGPPLEVFAPGEPIAGEPPAQWIQRYWEWVRSFGAKENPSADTTGFRCGAGQSGPVWFLTGSNAPAALRRECEVPEGKIILLPIINALVQASPGADAGCDRLLISLRQFSAGVSDLRLRINGTSVDRPERYGASTGCFSLRDAANGHTGLAAGSGYWIFLKALPRGHHELQFGARHPPTNFEQNITYVLHVR
jgi:hypothetical protein